MYSYFLKFFTIVIVCLYKQTLGLYYIHVFIFFFTIITLGVVFNWDLILFVLFSYIVIYVNIQKLN